MPYLDDIWYVGRARDEGAHGEFWPWHMLVPWDPWGQNGKKCSGTTNLVRRTTDASLR